MEQPSKVFIASSERASILAEKLRDVLKTEYCEPKLLTELAGGRPGSTMIEVLEEVATKYDYAVIVLATDDVVFKEKDDALKSRDCVFAAGLFMASLGRDHCFLVSSLDQTELPSVLGGVIYLHFKEPERLEDRAACAAAVATASPRILDRIQWERKQGRSARPFKLLSPQELLERQTLEAELKGGEVVVTALQPLETPHATALQVKKNMDQGIKYIYYFHGEDGARKICQMLQMLLLAKFIETAHAGDHQYRLRKLDDNKTEVLEDLQKICEQTSLKIVLLPHTPYLQYCIHNADDVDTATLYLKHPSGKFFEWARQIEAHNFWKEIRRLYPTDPEEEAGPNGSTPVMFYTTAGFGDEEKNSIYKDINRELIRFFPQIYKDVRDKCCGRT